MGVLAVVLVLLLAVFLLLSASIFLPISFRLRLTYLGGRLRYDFAFRTPLVFAYFVLLDESRRKARGRVEGPVPDKDARTSQDDIRTRIVRLNRVLTAVRSHYPEVAEITKEAVRSVGVKEFRTLVALGTADAAQTALLAGGLRALLEVALRLAKRGGVRFDKRPVMRITPFYEHAHLSADVELVWTIVPIRGMIAAYRLRKHIRKSKTMLQNAMSNGAGWNTRA